MLSSTPNLDPKNLIGDFKIRDSDGKNVSWISKRNSKRDWNFHPLKKKEKKRLISRISIQISKDLIRISKHFVQISVLVSKISAQISKFPRGSQDCRIRFEEFISDLKNQIQNTTQFSIQMKNKQTKRNKPKSPGFQLRFQNTSTQFQNILFQFQVGSQEFQFRSQNFQIWFEKLISAFKMKFKTRFCFPS